MAVQYYVASSIDGFIADADNKIDWLLQFGMEPYQEHYDRFIAGVGAIVMGSKTYEFLLDEGTESWPYAQIPTWVVTHRELPAIEGADVRFAAGDVGQVIQDAREAAGDTNVWLMGGGDVAAQAADLELVDEFHLTLMPIILGKGAPLLPLAEPTRPLALLRHTLFESGAVELVYSYHAAG
ncbi:dihydrofolate reductase family protein [Naasia sp. SYSU D00948]|uniref:dihydrofolate reductase family protein n=1 Tax=Naasia sp. SYSU D00948 TaxID=2817379 RepID=UPI001B306E4E|nr:dihydrofolate reductase family protein [Naasia sp. SYSU D00948]